MDTRRAQLLLLTSGAAGSVIFVVAYLINGALQPGYSTWHHTISTLSIAEYGWIQIVNFLICGALTVCFAEGLRRSGTANAWGFVPLVIAGLGLLVLGPFRSDPTLGFPAGRSDATTAVGTVHTISSLVVFVAFPIAIFALSRGSSRGWATFSITMGVSALAFVVLYTSMTHGHDPNSPTGLCERLPTFFICLWEVALCYRVVNDVRARPRYPTT